MSIYSPGWNRIRRGKSSSRPASMSNIRTYFEKWLKNEKFDVGPTRFKPGPMLFMVARTAEKFVAKS